MPNGCPSARAFTSVLGTPRCLSACADDSGATDETDAGADPELTPEVGPDTLEDPDGAELDALPDGGDVETLCELPPCVSVPVWRHDPTSGALLTFPDDVFTVVADTPTGLRVARTPETMPGLEDRVPSEVVNVVEHLSTLDGFGTSAGVERSDSVTTWFASIVQKGDSS